MASCSRANHLRTAEVRVLSSGGSSAIISARGGPASRTSDRLSAVFGVVLRR